MKFCKFRVGLRFFLSRTSKERSDFGPKKICPSKKEKRRLDLEQFCPGRREKKGKLNKSEED